MAEALGLVRAALLAIATGGGLLLIAAGIGHLRRFGGLRAILSVQHLVAHRWQRPVATMLVAAELGAGAGVVWAVALPGRHSVPMLAAQAAVYLSLLAYAATLRARRPAAPCGCFAGDLPAGTAVLLRAALLAAASGAAGLSGPGQPWPAAQLPVILAAAVVVAVGARVLPAVYGTAANP